MRNAFLSIVRLMARVKRLNMLESVCHGGLLCLFFQIQFKKLQKKCFPMLKSSSNYTILMVVDLITTIDIIICSKIPVLQETSPNMLSPTKKVSSSFQRRGLWSGRWHQIFSKKKGPLILSV